MSKNSKNTTNRRNTASATANAGVNLVSPRGKVHTVANLSRFAEKYNLDRSALSKVARGERGSHKNWTRQG